ncbi:MAG: right-handed parallel beta-helix repeat-containing protein [Anaerolineae bacterium]|nr:right-handed parallel beta-helix repeat-containing protein [Phycisphaerae bacterium]
MNVLSLLAGFAALTALVPSPVSASGSERGATVPWMTYEAEDANTSGTKIGPDYTGNTAAREASGRRCVRLTDTAQYLEIKAKSDSQGLVVRYSIPDSADGRGADATLSLYINGKLQQKLPMTSKYSYLYGAYPFKNEPAAGTPRNFWDELRLMPGAIRAGDAIRLQKDADDAATEYLIDFIDLEAVPAPLEKPADALAVTEFGATPNDASDDRAAFLAAITAAKTQKKTVWIPAGQFVVKGAIDVADVVIQGAGMWHTTLVGVDDYTPQNRVAFYGRGSNITLSDFAIVGKLNYRNDAEPNDGIGESFGTGSTIRNIWVEHTKAGAWIVNSDGLVVEGCRFRNNIADGINLCVGMRNSVVRNCTARGTGDDCFAMWPATYAKSTNSHGGNRFINCTAQLPFLAQAFSIYGGDSNSVENCEAIDIPYGAGLYASTTFPTEFGFRGTTTYRNVRITRAGDGDGAIGTVANLIDLVGVRFEDIEIIDSPKDGIRFTSMKEHALRDAAFDRIQISNPGLSGEGRAIAAAHGAAGSATISNVTIKNSKAPGWIDTPGFKLIQKSGNSGVNEGKPGS